MLEPAEGVAAVEADSSPRALRELLVSSVNAMPARIKDSSAATTFSAGGPMNGSQSTTR